MTTPPQTTVPDGETPDRCPYCDRPLRSEHLLALHVGERHPEECTDAEHEAAEAARQDETDELFLFHLKVILGLVVLFFAFAYAYVFVWTS